MDRPRKLFKDPKASRYKLDKIATKAQRDARAGNNLSPMGRIFLKNMGKQP